MQQYAAQSHRRNLIVNQQKSCQQACSNEFIYVLKISALVLITYGLMVGDFALCLAIEYDTTSTIPTSYINGGGILLGLFVVYVIIFGVAWCWGARKRESLRRMIVDKQLEMIRNQEKAEEEKDLEEERKMIEERRQMLKR